MPNDENAIDAETMIESSSRHLSGAEIMSCGTLHCVAAIADDHCVGPCGGCGVSCSPAIGAHR